MSGDVFLILEDAESDPAVLNVGFISKSIYLDLTQILDPEFGNITSNVRFLADVLFRAEFLFSSSLTPSPYRSALDVAVVIGCNPVPNLDSSCMAPLGHILSNHP